MAMTEVPEDTDAEENAVLKIPEEPGIEQEPVTLKLDTHEANTEDNQEDKGEQNVIEMTTEMQNSEGTETNENTKEEIKNNNSVTEHQSNSEIEETENNSSETDQHSNSEIEETENNSSKTDQQRNSEIEKTENNSSETDQQRNSEIENNNSKTDQQSNSEIEETENNNMTDQHNNSEIEEIENNNSKTDQHNNSEIEETENNYSETDQHNSKIEETENKNSEKNQHNSEKEENEDTSGQDDSEIQEKQGGDITNTDCSTETEENKDIISANKQEVIKEKQENEIMTENGITTDTENQEETTENNEENNTAGSPKEQELKEITGKIIILPADIEKALKSAESKEAKLQKEVSSLQDQLGQSRMLVRKLQSTLIIQQVESNNVVSGLKQQLKKNQDELKKQRLKYDRQLGEVISHLLFLEGQLKKEKKHISQVLKDRDEVIEKQKTEIASLTNTNNKLLQAVREIYGRKGKNGVVHEGTHAESDRPSSPSPKDKDKAKTPDRGRFSSLKDKLRRHRSSLDLTEADINVKGGLINSRQYSSQENLLSIGKRNKEARAARDRKCRSIAAYPDISLADLILEDPNENENRSNAEGDENMSSDFEHWKQKYLTNYTSSDSSSQSGSTGAIYINGHTSSSDGLDETSPASLSGSMPILSERDTNANLSPAKERPHSVSSIEHLHVNGDQTPPDKSPASSPTSTSFSEKNPFKNLKTILKRKGSKMKSNKKRTVSLSQPPVQQHQDSMKKHFEKFDMS